jgi:tagaturonate epimerase
LSNWDKACELLKKKGMEAKDQIESYGVYADSLDEYEGSFLFMIKQDGGKELVVFGKGPAYEAFFGEETRYEDQPVKRCQLTHRNCNVLRRIFPYTAPDAILGYGKTIGLGDRLGLASPGHIKLIKKYDIKPVLAQQSIRELNLTGRTYESVLDDASWAVYQEGYKGGFGADGDHLKKPEEIEMALNCGYTMITLDLSEHIDNNISYMSDAEVSQIYKNEDYSQLEARYSGREFTLKNGSIIRFSPEEYKKIVLTYNRAILFAIHIYQNYIKKHRSKIDFEISIDETHTPTTQQAHFFVAYELLRNEALVSTIAPRFCGEFQKGIDYIGDIRQFEEEFKMHVSIAEHFGYKISIHSGSDKFSVFPIIGEQSGNKYHLKTAGTSWLEAVRLIAACSPDLYRRIHQFALNNLDIARKYYHIRADPARIAPLDHLSDQKLPRLMDQDNARQVLHITYGLILQAKKPDGSSLFRDEIYSVLNEHEEEYSEALQRHFGRHVNELGLAER